MARNGTNGVKSDETLFAIVEQIGQADGVKLTEVATALEMSKSNVHSHLESLQDAGFVVREDDEYHVGLRFFDFGIRARNRRDIFDVAQPKLEDLSDRVGERTWCLVEENHQAVYLCGASAANPVKTPQRVGHHAPLHHLAGGKAILAYLPDAEVDEILAEQGLPAITEHTITDPDELFAELERVRADGIAYNMEEAMTGLRAISAPVLSVDDEVYGSVSLSGPAHRFSRERIESELKDLLLGVANEIELNLREF